jgi:hypothetical protein
MSDHPIPLTDDQIDELLSAELDDAFDATAHDLGFEPADARASLAATPRVDARRAALASARDALAEVPPYDELVLERLRDKAVRAAGRAHDDVERARARGRHRAFAAVATIAAAIIAIAGLAFVVNNGQGSNKSSSSASSASPTTSHSSLTTAGAPASRSRDFGRAATVQDLASSIKNAGGPAGFKAVSNTASGSAAANAAPDLTKSADRVAACSGQARAFSATEGTPVAEGTASVAGSPVLVNIFRNGGANILVVTTPDCRLLLQQTWPATP